MEEDSGQLLDSDMDSSASHQQYHYQFNSSQSHSSPTPERGDTRPHCPGHDDLDDSVGDLDISVSLDHSDNNDHLDIPVKNWRSKSLPAPYLQSVVSPPPAQISLLQMQKNTNTSVQERTGDGNSDKPQQELQQQQQQANKDKDSSSFPHHKNIFQDNPLNGRKLGLGLPSKISGLPSHNNNKREQDSDSKKRSEWRTLQQHYYPEGGWGWVVTFCALFSHALALGSQLYLSNVVFHYFQKGWLGAVSMGVSLLLSPIWVSICKRKSTRLAAVFGGLIAALGCLFTSFASQYHQLFFSYGTFLGVGVGLTRDASSLMVGQYFKRRREVVEIIVVSGSGLGILLMSVCIHAAISRLGWRLGLQAVTGTIFITFFLGTCYRSASLYHPQRRAILHLKNQKRKVKDKEKREDKPPFLDFSCLRSKTLQILLLSAAVTAFGINTPLFYLVLECRENKIVDYSIIILHIYVGAAWIAGSCFFGLLAIQKNQECRVSKQYLCQVASLICGMAILTLTAVRGFNGLVIFAWVYGFSLGGYNYALKVYTYERVRARHFPRAWSFIQCSQAIPLILGVPFTGYINWKWGWKSGYYFSALAVIGGSVILFLTDVRRRRLSRRKTQNSSIKTCETLESAQSPKSRRLSFAFPPAEQLSPNFKGDHHSHSSGHHGDSHHDMINVDEEPSVNLLKELTCISEEGLADIDFQDIYFEEWEEYFGADCITSCNKVENCLVSEYEHGDYGGHGGHGGGGGGHHIGTFSNLLDPNRRIRRWSAARPPPGGGGGGGGGGGVGALAHQTAHAHAGIGATAAALASGVAGMGGVTLSVAGHVPTRLFPVINELDTEGQGEDTFVGQGEGQGQGHGQGQGQEVRQIPSFRSMHHGPGHGHGRGRRTSQPQSQQIRTISVIDENSI